MSSSKQTTTTTTTTKMATASKGVECILDRSIVNDDTLSKMEDIGLSFFASACGKNRGAFVLDPPDGNTYSCLSLPPIFTKEFAAGSPAKGVVIADVNDITHEYDAQNITSAATVNMLDFLVQRVYQSSANVDKSLYGCDFNGLSTLDCPSVPLPSLKNEGDPIRAVALAGVFAPAPWATGGAILTPQEMESFYTSDDFTRMASMGLNTVQIPMVPDLLENMALVDVLNDYLAMIEEANLQAILVVDAKDPSSTVTKASMADIATFCQQHADVVLGVILPAADATLLAAVRSVTSSLPVFLPANEGTLTTEEYLTVGAKDPLVFGALELSHTSTVADVASSSSQEDRSKLFFHEATACLARAPLEYSQCWLDRPLFVSSGFDLAIDDCVLKELGDPAFKDYGQCNRFNETTYSPWWEAHRQSYAARQLFAYEQGLGWSFATWKLWPVTKKQDIENPADLLALETVAAAGLFPNIVAQSPNAKSACLNPPVTDFVMGDATYAPTLGPPPDCGYGWWNYTTNNCSYWVPPPTDAPTAQPTISCPVCEDCPALQAPWDRPQEWGIAAGVGALVAFLIVLALWKVCFPARKNRAEYTPLVT